MIYCTLWEKCVFFAVREEREEMYEYFTKIYCTGDFHDCARYRAALDMGQELVPDEIFPNEEAFHSLFSWAGKRYPTRASRRCHPLSPEKRQVPGPEKTATSSGHFPATRQTRSQH